MTSHTVSVKNHQLLFWKLENEKHLAVSSFRLHALWDRKFYHLKDDHAAFTYLIIYFDVNKNYYSGQ